MANSPHEMMVPLRTESDLPLALIGGKAVSLVRLARAGFPVPDGWLVTSEFFESWTDALIDSPEWQEVCALAGAAPARDGGVRLRAACEAVKVRARALVLDGRQQRVVEEIAAALGDAVCAVRSSSPEEDLAEASFADSTRRCWVSPPMRSRTRSGTVSPPVSTGAWRATNSNGICL